MPLKYEDDKYGLPEGIASVVRTYDLMLDKIKDPSQRDSTIAAMAERMREHYRQTGQKSFPQDVYKDLRTILDRAVDHQNAKLDRAKDLADQYKARDPGSGHEKDREK
jgi:hypothetical protein